MDGNFGYIHGGLEKKYQRVSAGLSTMGLQNKTNRISGAGIKAKVD